MTFAEYQKEAMRTLANPGLPDGPTKLAVMALGLTGEAGEVADLIKKHVGHGHPLTKTELERELGDVLWYLAAIATMNGIGLSDVAAVNIYKLRRRYPSGFSSAASLARVDEP